MSKDRLEPKKSNIRKISRKVRKENETRIKELVPMISKVKDLRSLIKKEFSMKTRIQNLITMVKKI